MSFFGVSLSYVFNKFSNSSKSILLKKLWLSLQISKNLIISFLELSMLICGVFEKNNFPIKFEYFSLNFSWILLINNWIVSLIPFLLVDKIHLW